MRNEALKIVDVQRFKSEVVQQIKVLPPQQSQKSMIITRALDIESQSLGTSKIIES